jgi:peptidoglycan/LPS O-acetylase OafA/YrhL
LEYLAQKTAYRSDIDGLRAIAVILVVLYHLQIPFVHSGFVGVDIFFVISGYLITSHIYRDLVKGKFSIKTFYLRRMRRILPALIVVLMFTTVAAYLILLPPDLKGYVKSLLASLFSVSNFYFWKSIHLGYFSTDADVMPLLHTWSLGVEEQFYFIWPVLLLALNKFFSKKNFMLVVCILTVVSFLIYYTGKSQAQFVYYSPFARGFELLLGGAVALLERKLIFLKTKQISHIVSLIAIASIIYAACIVRSSAYPGVIVLLPIVSACFLILSNSRGAGNVLLSSRGFVFIGLISYSLYLWHWPIIAYCHYIGIQLTPIADLIIVMASVGLSYLTLMFVEKPFRYKFKFTFRVTFLLYWLAPVVLAVLLILSIKYFHNYGFNTVPKNIQNMIDNQYYGPLTRRSNCHNDIGGDQFSALNVGSILSCLVGNLQQNNLSAIIVGDSHAMSYVGMIDQFLKNANYKGYVVTQSNAPFLDVDLISPERSAKANNERKEVVKHLIEGGAYHYVIMGGAWSDKAYTFQTVANENRRAVFKKGLEKSIQLIIKNNAIPVILMDFPSLYNVPVTCGLSRLHSVNCYNKLSSVTSEQRVAKEVMLQLSRKYTQVILIDPKKIICDKDKCYSSLEGVPLYFGGKDNSHLDYAGSSLVGKLYIEKYGNPLVKSGK